MSGNFVQRGAPALLDKHLRVRAALDGGADLVVELPLPYACATAERFAFGGVCALAALGCVDRLFFGSECGDIDLLRQAAQAVDDPAVGAAMAPLLDQGLSFPLARQEAVEQVYSPQLGQVLAQPNNTLGVEYLRQLRLLGVPMEPATMAREGAGHDSPATDGFITSASQLRSLISQGAMGVAAGYMPKLSGEICKASLDAGIAPASFYPAERALLARLRSMTVAELADLPDVTEGLENRLLEAIQTSTTLEGLLTAFKTKRYPLTRLRRILVSAFLGITRDLCHRPVPYLHLLGMNSAGREILSAAQDKCSLPLSHSLAQLRDLGGDAARFALLEARSTDLYSLMLPTPAPCGLDYTTPLVKV